MTRKEFLTELDRRLSSLPRHEVDEHITYYAEMLADRMEEGMSEQEAVSSMESVDTIAARILSTHHTATAKKKHTGRTIVIPIAAIIFIFLIISVVISGVSSLFTFRTSGQTVIYTEELVAFGESTRDFSAQGIRNLKIDWISDDVVFHLWDEDTIRLQEDGSQPLMICTVEGDTLHVRRDTDDISVTDSNGNIFSIDDSGIILGGLVIDESGIRWGNNSIDNNGIHVGGLEIGDDGIRWNGNVFDGSDINITVEDSSSLTVWLPRSLAENGLDSIAVNVVSAEVDMCGINAKELALTSISGDCTVDGQFENVTVSTTSGEVFFTGSFADGMFNTVSGELCITADAALRSFDANSVSGEVSLSIPANTGFKLKFDTSSGNLRSAFVVTERGEKYICGDGSVAMKVDTVSGDFVLYGY